VVDHRHLVDGHPPGARRCWPSWPTPSAQAGPWRSTSVGGVDAAKRVQAGEAFDVVVLASDAIDKLIAAGHVRPAAGSTWCIGRGRGGARRRAAPDIGSEAALRAAVLAAPSIGYSTGPSGVQLAAAVRALGHRRRDARRWCRPPPGVPVGSWWRVARWRWASSS
jgi:molybdate transport system substrate-binding protein